MNASQPPADMANIATVSKRPRTKPAETRREELMDAAQALFLEKGFDAPASMKSSRRPTSPRAPFYFYFKSKDDVLQGLRERFLENVLSTSRKRSGWLHP